MSATEPAPQGTPQAASGNGQHDAPAPHAERAPHEPAAQEARAEPSAQVTREFHAEPREPGPAHESLPVAHFEPSPRAETGNPPNTPYVVWSSAPAQKDTGNRGPEE